MKKHKKVKNKITDYLVQDTRDSLGQTIWGELWGKFLFSKGSNYNNNHSGLRQQIEKYRGMDYEE